MSTDVDTECFPLNSWVEFTMVGVTHRGVVVDKDSHGLAIRYYAQRQFHKVWISWAVVAGRSVVTA